MCHNATEIGPILTFGTRAERTPPESAVRADAAAFTARCRRGSSSAAPYPAQLRSAAAQARLQTLNEPRPALGNDERVMASLRARFEPANRNGSNWSSHFR